jgi:hypothetical protein
MKNVISRMFETLRDLFRSITAQYSVRRPHGHPDFAAEPTCRGPAPAPGERPNTLYSMRVIHAVVALNRFPSR